MVPLQKEPQSDRRSVPAPHLAHESGPTLCEAGLRGGESVPSGHGAAAQRPRATRSGDRGSANGQCKMQKDHGVDRRKREGTEGREPIK